MKGRRKMGEDGQLVFGRKEEGEDGNFECLYHK